MTNIDEAFRLSPDEIARREQHEREFAILVERAKAKHKPWRDGAMLVRSIEQTEYQLDYDEEYEFGWAVGN